MPTLPFRHVHPHHYVRNRRNQKRLRQFTKQKAKLRRSHFAIRVDFSFSFSRMGISLYSFILGAFIFIAFISIDANTFPAHNAIFHFFSFDIQIGKPPWKCSSLTHSRRAGSSSELPHCFLNVACRRICCISRYRLFPPRRTRFPIIIFGEI